MVCSICGSVVADTAKHTRFHQNLILVLTSPLGEDMALKQSESVLTNISFTDVGSD
jgi:hypothetical protein